MADSTNMHNLTKRHEETLADPEATDTEKQHASAVLGDTGSTGVSNFESSKNEGNVIGGYKATLKNPRVSEEAKQNAREVLEERDAL